MTLNGIADAPTTTAPRRTLVVPTTVLLLAQITHLVVTQAGVTPVAHHPAPSRALHTIGIAVTVIVLGAAASRKAVAPRLMAAVGAAIAGGVLLAHILPISTPYTTYYGGTVSAWQWLVALGVVAAAAWTALQGWRHQSGPHVRAAIH